MPETPEFEPITQVSFGKSVYTTASRVRFAVIDPQGGFGELVVDIAPGEIKTVTVNGHQVTIHRPRIM